MTQSLPTKLPRSALVAINRRHQSEKAKLRNVAKKAVKK